MEKFLTKEEYAILRKWLNSSEFNGNEKALRAVLLSNDGHLIETISMFLSVDSQVVIKFMEDFKRDYKSLGLLFISKCYLRYIEL